MNSTTKIYGTTYTVETVNDYPDELLLTGPRGAGYLLQPITGRPGVFILNSLTSGEKRVKGNRAYVAVIAGEIVEAGLGRIDADVAAAAELATLPEIAEDTETLTDDELAELDAQGAELDADTTGTDWDAELVALLAEDERRAARTAEREARNVEAEAQAHLAASSALAGLKAQTLAGVEAGLDPDDAYAQAVAAMVAMDKRGMMTLALYDKAGRLAELG